MFTSRGSPTKLLGKDEARRITANFAKLRASNGQLAPAVPVVGAAYLCVCVLPPCAGTYMYMLWCCIGASCPDAVADTGCALDDTFFR
jgi:hypothetical protein